MTEEGPRSWSGPAITAKFFWPAGVFVFVGILVVPVHDFFTALWFFLVVLPLGVAAVWLFVGVGQVLPCVEGLLYRRWAKWKMVRWQEGLEVKGVLPFFGALVVNGEVRVYFLLEPENRDLIGPAGRVGPSRDVAGAPARCERQSGPVVCRFRAIGRARQQRVFLLAGIIPGQYERLFSAAYARGFLPSLLFGLSRRERGVSLDSDWTEAFKGKGSQYRAVYSWRRRCILNLAFLSMDGGGPMTGKNGTRGSMRRAITIRRGIC